jgi:membrane-associated protease RseP (regulator of RpoE activity)
LVGGQTNKQTSKQTNTIRKVYPGTVGMAERRLFFRSLQAPAVSAADAQVLADQVRALVARDLVLESVQVARDQEREGVVVVRGRLLRPSHEVFPRWLAELKRWGYTPILRPADRGEDEVVLHVVAGIPPRTASRVWINVALFVVTVISTLFVGAIYRQPALAADLAQVFLPANLLLGMPFAFTLLGILTAHEFGHYFAARFHAVAVTLPYFLPLPLPLGIGGGTLGAFIRLREPVPDRRKLFDIGVAGPLAGLVVAIPLLFYGLSRAQVGEIPVGREFMLEGNSVLYYVAKLLVFGRPLPDWSARLDVMLDGSPIVSAAWFGLLVTAINLLPLGQLDGGHAVFAMFGEKARYINRGAIGILVALALSSLPPVQQYLPWLSTVGYEGWFLWLLLIFLLIGPYHPPALDDVTRLDRRRRWLGYLVILIFILIFVPVPVRIMQL